MGSRRNAVVLVVVILALAVIGVISVTGGLGFQDKNTQSRAEKSDKICDPTDCRNSENSKSANCSCRYSVVLIDLGEKGLDLTNVQSGVDFDLNSDGRKQRVSWTAADSAESFLYLDRNGSNGVDNSLELFGNLTTQLPSSSESERNGFLALAYYERSNLGGNGDGIIDQNDSLFSTLRLWRDANHNGVSEPNEIRTLKESGIGSISLAYKKLGRSDQWGNLIRYEADIYGAGKKLGTAYDVVLLPPL